MRAPRVVALRTVNVGRVNLTREGDLPSLLMSTGKLASPREACTFPHHSGEKASCMRRGTKSSPLYFATSRSTSGVLSRIYFESISLAVHYVQPSLLTPGNASQIST